MERHWVRNFIAAGLVLAGAHTLFAATPQPPQSTPALADTWPAFVGKRVEALSHSGDAHALLTAALLDRVDDASNGQRFNELLGRAQHAAPNDPLVWWVTATQCRGHADDECAAAQAAARAKLEVIDPDNAATWLISAAAAGKAGDPAAAAHAFAKAAAAKSFDEHLVTGVKVLTSQLIGHPLAADGAMGSRDEEAYQLVWAVATAFVIPNAQVPFGVCTPDKKPVQDATTATQCLNLARSMQRGDSLFAMSLGLRLEQRLLVGMPEEADVARRQRDHNWRMNQRLALAPRLDGDAGLARQYRSVLFASNSENTALERVLTAQGIPLNAPADWQEPHTY